MTFHSTYHALNFEKALKSVNMEVKLIPVPRDLSSSCGSAAKFNCQDYTHIQRLVEDHGIEVDEMHEREEDQKQPGLLERILRKKES